MPSEYTLCDNYFTDVAGPSTPNHLMLIMADSALIDNPSTNYRKQPGPPLYDQPSLPSQLDAAGLTWGNYDGYAFEFIKYTAGKRPDLAAVRHGRRRRASCRQSRGSTRTASRASTRRTRRPNGRRATAT